MYNALTGRNERVGNWAGVTVEKTESIVIGASASKSVEFVDGGSQVSLVYREVGLLFGRQCVKAAVAVGKLDERKQTGGRSDYGFGGCVRFDVDPVETVERLLDDGDVDWLAACDELHPDGKHS